MDAELMSLNPRLRALRTSNLYLAFVGLGFCVAVPGPTLLDLEQLVNTVTDHIAFIYPARSVGYLVGSLIGGILFDCFNRQVILIMALLVTSITIAAVPWFTHIALLSVNWAICGIALGMTDTGSNVWCLDLWKKDSGPYLQALHFFFGVGAFMAPLLAQPFLSSTPSEPSTSAINFTENDSTVDDSKVALDVLNNSAMSNATTADIASSNATNIHYVYGAIGIFNILVTVLFLIAFAMSPVEIKPDPKLLRKSRTKKDRRLDNTLIILTAVFISLYSGLEIAFGQFLTTFAVKGNLKLSKAVGSFMTSVYWGSYTVFRGVGIVGAKFLSNHAMLVIDLSLVLIGNVFTVFGNSVGLFLWVGAFLLGAGVASIFPSTVAYVEEHTEISNRKVSVFLVTISLGEMLIPLFVGTFIDSFPMILVYVNCVCGGLCCIVFILMRWIATKCGNKYHSAGTTEKSSKHAAEPTPTTSTPGEDHSLQPIN